MDDLISQRSRGHSDPLYSRWLGIRCRHVNTTSKISKTVTQCLVYEPWVKSYELFCQDVGQRPDPSARLVRRNRNKGWEPGNVRWSSNPAGYKVDLTGERFSRGVAIARHVLVGDSRKVRKETWWKLRCDCGNEYMATYRNLVSGRQKSCGCARLEYFNRGKKVKSLEGPDSVPADSRSDEAGRKTACR